MRSLRLSEWAFRPGGVASSIATKAGYAAAAVIVGVTLSLAAQHMFVAAAPLPEAEVEQSPPGSSRRPIERPSRASFFVGDEDHPLGWPAAPTNSPAGRPTDVATAESAPTSEEPATGWWSGLAGLLANLPFAPDSPPSTPSAAPVGAGSANNGGTSSSTTAQRASGGPARTISFGTSEATACETGAGRFDLNDVSDLYVCVAFPGLSGTYAEQLTFILPDGNVYQTMTVPFMTPDMSLGTDPAFEFGGRQWQATRARRGADGETLVTARLPVAGTFITQYTLAGLWTVQVRLDGQPITQDTFELVQ